RPAISAVIAAAQLNLDIVHLPFSGVTGWLGRPTTGRPRLHSPCTSTSRAEMSSEPNANSAVVFGGWGTGDGGRLTPSDQPYGLGLMVEAGRDACTRIVNRRGWPGASWLRWCRSRNGPGTSTTGE